MTAYFVFFGSPEEFLLGLMLQHYFDDHTELGNENIDPKDVDPDNPNFSVPIAEFKITVPKTYKKGTYIDAVIADLKDGSNSDARTVALDEIISSDSFKNATNDFVPGKSYMGKVVITLDATSNDEIVEFIQNKKGILPGAHGMLLARKEAMKKIPKGLWIVCPDVKKALPAGENRGSRMIPVMHRCFGGGFRFRSAQYKNIWPEIIGVLYFVPVK